MPNSQIVGEEVEANFVVEKVVQRGRSPSYSIEICGPTYRKTATMPWQRLK